MNFRYVKDFFQIQSSNKLRLAAAKSDCCTTKLQGEQDLQALYWKQTGLFCFHWVFVHSRRGLCTEQNGQIIGSGVSWSAASSWLCTGCFQGASVITVSWLGSCFILIERKDQVIFVDWQGASSIARQKRQSTRCKNKRILGPKQSEMPDDNYNCQINFRFLNCFLFLFMFTTARQGQRCRKRFDCKFLQTFFKTFWPANVVIRKCRAQEHKNNWFQQSAQYRPVWFFLERNCITNIQFVFFIVYVLGGLYQVHSVMISHQMFHHQTFTQAILPSEMPDHFFDTSRLNCSFFTFFPACFSRKSERDNIPRISRNLWQDCAKPCE